MLQRMWGWHPSCTQATLRHYKLQCFAALQVLNKEFEVLTHLATVGSGFGKREAFAALGGLVDKIHELKHK